MDEARPGNLGNLGNVGSKKSQKQKFSKSKSVSPKMLARSGLVGKNSSRPHLGPSLAIFCVGRKNRKNVEVLPIILGGPMGPIHPAWGNGCNISSATRMWGSGFCRDGLLNEALPDPPKWGSSLATCRDRVNSSHWSTKENNGRTDKRILGQL